MRHGGWVTRGSGAGTWWMMPLPGPQKPRSNLEEEVDRKLYLRSVTRHAAWRGAALAFSRRPITLVLCRGSLQSSMASQVEQPDSPKSSSGARDAQDADAKGGAAEPKEPKPKGSGRADCLCFVCNRILPLSEFSGSQKKKKRDCRKCLTCALLPVLWCPCSTACGLLDLLCCLWFAVCALLPVRCCLFCVVCALLSVLCCLCPAVCELLFFLCCSACSLVPAF